MKHLVRFLLVLLLIIIIILTIIILNGYKLYKTKIEEISLKDKIANLKESEKYTLISEVPDYYKNAIIAVEDHRYYEHGPVDYIAIARALVSNFKAKDFNEGGSTITQQVAKNLYLITEDDFISRKIAEIFLSIDLENNYSKDEILEIYINTIYFGNGYYNIHDAAKGYYKKKPIELDLYEATLLAGVPNAPSVYAPTVNPDLAKSRQKKVLSDMVEYNYLSKKEAENIINLQQER